MQSGTRLLRPMFSIRRSSQTETSSSRGGGRHASPAAALYALRMGGGAGGEIQMLNSGRPGAISSVEVRLFPAKARCRRSIHRPERAFPSSVTQSPVTTGDGNTHEFEGAILIRFVLRDHYPAGSRLSPPAMHVCAGTLQGRDSDT